jgi:hypothetical protein
MTESQTTSPQGARSSAYGAIRPWQHRFWIFPRDPDFEDKAGWTLDLYHRVWKGRRLRSDKYVILPTRRRAA